MKVANKFKIPQLFLIMLSATLFTSCAANDKFACKDAKGAHCVMLHDVDAQVSSGEIEKYFAPVKGQSCSRGKCANAKTDPQPALKSPEEIKIKLIPEKANKITEKEGYLYVQ